MATKVLSPRLTTEVIVGGVVSVCTVNVAVLLLVLPCELEIKQRNWAPLSDAATGESV